MILKKIEEQTGTLTCNSSIGVWYSEQNETFDCIIPGNHAKKTLHGVIHTTIEQEGSAEPELPLVNYTKIEEHIDEMARIITELNKIKKTSPFTKTVCNMSLLLILLSLFTL